MFVLIVPAHAEPPAEHRHQRQTTATDMCQRGTVSGRRRYSPRKVPFVDV